MRTISNILAAACVLLGCATAQDKETPQLGFIRFVQAVAAGEGKTNLLIDGEDIYKKGYDLGQRTGGLALKSGAHNISVKKTGVETGTAKVSLAVGETVTLIGFSEKIPPKKEGDPPVWAAKVLKLKQSDAERGFRLTMISVCDKEEITIKAEAMGKGTVETAHVKRLATSTVDLGNARGEVLVKIGDEILTVVSPDGPGNYVVLLYQDPDGKTKALSFFDPKFVIAG